MGNVQFNDSKVLFTANGVAMDPDCCCFCGDTYYVDSAAGDQAETGSGTEIDPWINFNTVFSDDGIYTKCTGSPPCNQVRVYVKGTIDYTVDGIAGRNYLRNLEIIPWGVATITISISAAATTYAMRDCVGCVFNYVVATGTTTGVNNFGYGFYNCSSSTFNNCDGNGYKGAGAGSGYGFHSCSSSTFNTCTADGTSSGFFGCGLSTFNNCEGTGGGFGFSTCTYSDFVACTGVATGVLFQQGRGFHGCGYSTFDTCIGAGTGITQGYGFQACDGSSTFDTCTGGGYVIASSGCRKACGFHSNTGASYIDCSTTDRICLTCGPGVCAAFTCDI